MKVSCYDDKQVKRAPNLPCLLWKSFKNELNDNKRFKMEQLRKLKRTHTKEEHVEMRPFIIIDILWYY